MKEKKLFSEAINEAIYQAMEVDKKFYAMVWEQTTSDHVWQHCWFQKKFGK